MRYLILLVLLALPVRAGWFEDLILTPFSWSDAEIKKYIAAAPANVGTVKFTTLIVMGERVVSKEVLAKIVEKDAADRDVATIKAIYEICTIDEVKPVAVEPKVIK